MRTYLVDNFVYRVAKIASFVADVVLWRLWMKLRLRLLLRLLPIGHGSDSSTPWLLYTLTWQAWPPSLRRSSKANSPIHLRLKNLTKSHCLVVFDHWKKKWEKCLMSTEKNAIKIHRVWFEKKMKLTERVETDQRSSLWMILG